MSLKKVLNDAKDAITDLATLEVRTYVGTLEVNIDDQNKPDIQALLKNAQTTGTLELVQVTSLSLDGDGTNIVSPNPQPEHIAKAHQAALEAANNVRAGILELFNGLILKD